MPQPPSLQATQSPLLIYSTSPWQNHESLIQKWKKTKKQSGCQNNCLLLKPAAFAELHSCRNVCTEQVIRPHFVAQPAASADILSRWCGLFLLSLSEDTWGVPSDNTVLFPIPQLQPWICHRQMSEISVAVSPWNGHSANNLSSAYLLQGQRADEIWWGSGGRCLCEIDNGIWWKQNRAAAALICQHCSKICAGECGFHSSLFSLSSFCYYVFGFLKGGVGCPTIISSQGC